ncbi:MAG: peptidoglycan DD-metalloendopeptidase family protein [Betaproteobacteria bacterium]|nr:peptidoglycan DD-metalloendopeptidase family protein [Betaproteobacteria bacterium]
MLLAGCGISSKLFAPIREIGKLGRPAEYYLVQPGDTLHKIAYEFGLDVRDLAAWNELSDPNHIRAGERLRVLPPRVGKVAASAPEAGRKADKNASKPAPDMDSEPTSWVWPLRGKLLEGFNESVGNKGIDIAGVIGEPIVATTNGVVVYTGVGLRGYGKLTIIRHSSTALSAYAHQSRILVSEGQVVSQGQKIGEVGDSDAERVKLHFEIRRLGRPVDPLLYLSKTG